MNISEARNLVNSKGLKLDLIDTHIGFRVGDTVAINKNLFSYDPSWVDSILDHELRHTGKFTFHDFFMDFFEGSLVKTIKFCKSYPGAWSQFNPIFYYDGSYTIDVNLFINYFIVSFIFLFIVYGGVHYF